MTRFFPITTMADKYMCLKPYTHTHNSCTMLLGFILAEAATIMTSFTEWAKRRNKLLRKIGPDSIAILPCAPLSTRNADYDFPYRQNSDFYYMTGFEEPEAI